MTVEEACTRLRAAGFYVEVHANEIEARQTPTSFPEKRIMIKRNYVSALAVKKVLNRCTNG